MILYYKFIEYDFSKINYINNFSPMEFIRYTNIQYN